MKEVLKIEDKSKCIGCTFKIDELNIDSNKNFIIYKYNEIQSIKKDLDNARNLVRNLENNLKELEDLFRLIEPLVKLDFITKEKDWESEEINGAVINSTDYRNVKL